MGDTINLEISRDMLKSLVSEEVSSCLAGKGLDQKSMRKALKDAADADEKFAYIERLWHNNGWANPRDAEELDPEIRWKEAISFQEMTDILTPDQNILFFPKLISTVVKEAAEPLIVLTNFFKRINYHGSQIQYPALSNTMAPEDMGPTEEYPETDLSSAGIVTAKVGKVGMAFKLSEDVTRYSAFDLANLYYRAAGRAMVRFKEQKAADLMAAEGTVGFDNTGGTSVHGYTTGRGSDGYYNGTLTLDDLFVAYADHVNMGFLPNTLFMNAMGWLIFARNPELRAFGFANGGPIFQPLQGQPGQRPTFATGGVNLGPSAGTPLSSGNPQLNPQASTYTNVPSLFPAPMRIVVSPFIRFDATNQRTDVIMADANEIGALVQDEELYSESWNDPMRDITYTKLRERYGFALDNQGEGLYQIKNLKLVRGWDWETVRSWQMGTGSLPTSTSGC